jgi:hypothetical protein
MSQNAISRLSDILKRLRQIHAKLIVIRDERELSNLRSKLKNGQL